MVQARGAVAPAHLLILLLVALRAQDVETAPWRARELAVPVGDGHPTSQPDLVQEPQGDPRDAGTGRAFPASRLDPALELTWHPRDPQRAKYKAETGKSSQQSSEVLEEFLKELNKAAHEADGETVLKEVLQEGGSHTVPVSAEKRGAIQSTGVPGVDGKRNTNATDPKDFQKYCIEGAVAVLGSVLFGMVLCCAICLWRKRKQRLSAASGARPDTSSCPSRPDRQTACPSTPERRTHHQQPPPVPGKPACLPWSPGETPAPTSPDSLPAHLPPPQLPSDLPGSPTQGCGLTQQAAKHHTGSVPQPAVGWERELKKKKKVTFLD